MQHLPNLTLVFTAHHFDMPESRTGRGADFLNDGVIVVFAVVECAEKLSHNFTSSSIETLKKTPPNNDPNPHTI